MKTFLVTVVFVFLAGFSAFSQGRTAYVNSELILKHMPDYVSAKKELDSRSLQWQKDADGRQAEIDKLSKSFQAEWPLLTDEMRKHRQSEITTKEKEVRDFYNSKFGVEGELVLLHDKLVKPLQDKVAKAIQIYAEKNQLDEVKDLAVNPPLYLLPRYDKTNDIIQQLGLKVGAFAE